MAAPASSVAPDLSPVAEPSGVVLVARARNLAATLGSAERMARIPLSVENEIRKKLREEDADVFKLDAGVDFILLLDPESKDDKPKFLAAVSLPVSDIEQTRAALERGGRDVTPLVPGVYRTKVRDASEKVEQEDNAGEGGDDYDIEEKAPKLAYCDLAACVGDASARLVCSESAEELDLLRPWLTRGLPTTPLLDNDFYSELRFGPFRDRYLPVARAQLPGVEFLAKRWMDTELNIREPRLLAIPGQLMQEGLAFLDDLDRISFSGKLDAGASEMSFKGKISFRNKTAWLTQVYTDTNDEAGMPPDLFWRLPREADSASYARSADPKLYEGVRDTLRLLVSDLLTQTPLSAASKSSVEAFLAAAPTSKVTVVSARGTNPFKGLRQANKKQPSGKPPSARDAIAELENVVNASVGWSIVGVDAPAAEYADWIKKGVAAYDRVLRDAKNDKDMGKEIRDAKWIPSMRVQNNVAGYPRGSMGVNVTVRFDSKQIWDYTMGKLADAPEHPKGPAARGSITLQVVVVPDGANRTWIGMSTDSKLLKEKMSSVLTPGGRDTTIASLPGLEALRSTPTVAAGYFTYGNLLTQTIEAVQKESGVDPETVKKVVASLPNRLTTPVLLLNTGTAGSAPTNEIEFRVQRGTVEDIAGFVQFALSPEGRKIIDQLNALDAVKAEEEAVEVPAE